MWYDPNYKDTLLRDALHGELREAERLQDFARAMLEDADFAEEYVELRKLTEEVSDLAVSPTPKFDIAARVMERIPEIQAPQARRTSRERRLMLIQTILLFPGLLFLMYVQFSDLSLSISASSDVFERLSQSGRELFEAFSQSMSKLSESLESGWITTLIMLTLAMVVGVNAWSARESGAGKGKY